MNRNVESHFSLLPQIDIQRSKFDRSHSLKTTLNVGDVVPIYLEEVLPGDSFDVRTNRVVRLQTPITPIMDNIYMDTYFFFVPNRLVWEHWRELHGENTQSAWIPQVEYEVPQILSPVSTGWTQGTLADYFGIPTGVPGLSVNALPFRAYALIMNEFFRDENLTQPLNIPVDDTTVAGVNTGDYITDVVKGGLPFKAAKYHDYFTSCLPYPQKGDSVPIPVASSSEGQFSISGNLPVFGNGYNLGITDGSATRGLYLADDPVRPLISTGAFGVLSPDSTGGSGSGSAVSIGNGLGVLTKSLAGTHPEYSGLIGDVSDLTISTEGIQINAGTINELRMAFQMQKALERDARGGTRYIEMIKSHFGVSNPDYRLQRPEYLGGNRIPININSVSANSSATNQPLGTQGAYSMTLDSHDDFFQSFTEHGFIIGVCVCRYDHTYQQGLDKLWSRKTRFDYFLPVFSAIGEQPVLNKQIYAQGSSVVDEDGNIIDDQVFGYQEAWAEYRYKPNFVTGEMRSNVTGSLDIWHLADDYSELPILSDGWIREDGSVVDRVLTVTSAVSNQLFMDIAFDSYATRPMPVYSVPGLIDHF